MRVRSQSDQEPVSCFAWGGWRMVASRTRDSVFSRIGYGGIIADGGWGYLSISDVFKVVRCVSQNARWH